MKKFSTYTLLQKSLVMSAIFFSLSGAFVSAMGGGGGPGEKEGGDGDKPPVPRTSLPSGTSQREPTPPPPYGGPEEEARVFNTIAVVAARAEVLEAQQREMDLQKELAAMRLQLAERDRKDAEDRVRREQQLREEAEAKATAAQRQQQESDARAADLLRQQQETAAQMAALATQMEALRTQQVVPPSSPTAPVPSAPQAREASLGVQAERFISALAGRKGGDKQREALRHPGKFFK